MKQKKLIQVKYPPFDTTVKTYADIYKYEDEMQHETAKKVNSCMNGSFEFIYTNLLEMQILELVLKILPV